MLGTYLIPSNGRAEDTDVPDRKLKKLLHSISSYINNDKGLMTKFNIIILLLEHIYISIIQPSIMNLVI